MDKGTDANGPGTIFIDRGAEPRAGNDMTGKLNPGFSLFEAEIEDVFQHR